MIHLRPFELLLVIVLSCTMTLSTFSWYLNKELDMARMILDKEMEYQLAEKERLKTEINLKKQVIQRESFRHAIKSRYIPTEHQST